MPLSTEGILSGQAEEIKFWGSDKKCGILVTGKISFVDSMEDLDV